VTDFDFSPFDDNALVTGGEEGVVKMWQLPSDPSQCGTGQSFVCSASIGPMQGGGHIEKLSFNPVASNVLGGTAGKNVYIWDMNTQQEKYMFSQHDNVVQSFSWDGAGNLLTTIAKKDKQKQLIVIDPRANAVVTVSLHLSFTHRHIWRYLSDNICFELCPFIRGVLILDAIL
jgi:WD40 repeat protein